MIVSARHRRLLRALQGLCDIGPIKRAPRSTASISVAVLLCFEIMSADIDEHGESYYTYAPSMAKPSAIITLSDTSH